MRNLKDKEQVLFNIHDALGIKWGEDPYAVIAAMRQPQEEENAFGP
jgi:hypothetical protein